MHYTSRQFCRHERRFLHWILRRSSLLRRFTNQTLLRWSVVHCVCCRISLCARFLINRGKIINTDSVPIFLSSFLLFPPLFSFSPASPLSSLHYINVRITGFDDALDAFGVHAIGGVVGGIAVGFFATPQVSAPFGFGDRKGIEIKGVYYGGLEVGGRQLAVQIVGILFSAGWAFIVTLGILMCIEKTIGLRVSEEAEEVGLDFHPRRDEHRPINIREDCRTSLDRCGSWGSCLDELTQYHEMRALVLCCYFLHLFCNLSQVMRILPTQPYKSKDSYVILCLDVPRKSHSCGQLHACTT